MSIATNIAGYAAKLVYDQPFVYATWQEGNAVHTAIGVETLHIIEFSTPVPDEYDMAEAEFSFSERIKATCWLDGSYTVANSQGTPLSGDTYEELHENVITHLLEQLGNA